MTNINNISNIYKKTEEKETADYYIGMGRAFSQNSMAEEACKNFQKAVDLSPRSAPLCIEFAESLIELGRFDDADMYCKKAIELEPDFAIGYYTAGRICYTTGNYTGAKTNFKKAVEKKPDYPDALCGLGFAAFQTGNKDEALQCFRKALFIEPGFETAVKGLKSIYVPHVSRQYFRTLNNSRRNFAFDSAIKKTVSEKDVVLEIGTGAGLLSMMAARAGARQVYTCEPDPYIAEKACEIIKYNNFDKQIKVLNTNSLNIHAGQELPSRADVLIADISKTGFWKKSVVDAIRHARTNLLKAGAVIVPKRVAIHAMLVESQTLSKHNNLGSVSGFDLSPFNDFADPSHFNTRMKQAHSRRLSNHFRALVFDFIDSSLQTEDRSVDVTIKENGTCHAVVFWCNLYLDDTIRIDNGPESPESPEQAVQLLKRPLNVKKGDRITITAKYDLNAISFQFPSFF